MWPLHARICGAQRGASLFRRMGGDMGDSAVRFRLPAPTHALRATLDAHERGSAGAPKRPARKGVRAQRRGRDAAPHPDVATPAFTDEELEPLRDTPEGW